MSMKTLHFTCIPAGREHQESLRLFSERLFRSTYEALNTVENMELYCQQAFSVTNFAHDFSRPGVQYLLAMDGAGLAGYAKLVMEALADSGPNGASVEIARFYIDVPYQGKGLAHWFMGECLRWARQQGCQRAWLGVWPQNPRAIRFYEKEGFIKTGTAQFLLGTDPQIDDIMQKEL